MAMKPCLSTHTDASASISTTRVLLSSPRASRSTSIKSYSMQPYKSPQMIQHDSNASTINTRSTEYWYDSWITCGEFFCVYLFYYSFFAINYIILLQLSEYFWPGKLMKKHQQDLTIISGMLTNAFLFIFFVIPREVDFKQLTNKMNKLHENIFKSSRHYRHRRSQELSTFTHSEIPDDPSHDDIFIVPVELNKSTLGFAQSAGENENNRITKHTNHQHLTSQAIIYQTSV